MLEQLLARTKDKLDQTEGWDRTILEDEAGIKEPEIIKTLIHELEAFVGVPSDTGEFLYRAGVYFRLCMIYGSFGEPELLSIRSHTASANNVGPDFELQEQDLLYGIGLSYLRFKSRCKDRSVSEVLRNVAAENVKSLLDKLNAVTGATYRPPADVLPYLGNPAISIGIGGKM